MSTIAERVTCNLLEASGARRNQNSLVVFLTLHTWQEKNGINKNSIAMDKTTKPRRWRFRSYTTKRRNNKPFTDEIFHDHTEMKVFSANESAQLKPTFPNYWSEYFDVDENGNEIKP